MRRTAILWEVFVTRFQEAFEQYEKHRLSSEEAGELLGMSGRNFRRLCVRYEEDGIEGLRDWRIGKNRGRQRVSVWSFSFRFSPIFTMLKRSPHGARYCGDVTGLAIRRSD
jgi:hypothetical protein